MSCQPTQIVLKPDEREALGSLVRSSSTEQRYAFRARVVLLADEGCGTHEIARRLAALPATVTKWRLRFARQRMEGIQNMPRPEKQWRYGPTEERRVLAMLDEEPPSPGTRGGTVGC